MAKHARLVAPVAPPQVEWPWHTATWMAMPLSALAHGERRFEAENYLSNGYGLRLAIEHKARGWQRFGAVAKVWQPLRLKGILVGAQEGVPFLAATQVFDIRPVPRKWLAIERTSNAVDRFVTPGQILVTRSGAVGRASLAYSPHENTLISDDLLRVDALSTKQQGWLYAYLRAPQTRAMMSGAQYGHIIKHLEVAHLEQLPIPAVDTETAAEFQHRMQRLLALRNQAYEQTLESERLFEKAVGPLTIEDYGESGFSVNSAHLLTGRRRIDASYSSPIVSRIWKHFEKKGRGFTSLQEAGYEVWVPGRYKRIPASDGPRYFDSADLLEVTPDNTKQFAECGFGDKYHGRVKKNWLLMPSSGQVYGIIGSVVLANASFAEGAISNHVIRIAPSGKALRPGYVLTALAHPVFGRPLIKALAFGSSVPEIDEEAVRTFRIVRIDPAIESEIADLAEASAEARAEADSLEQELSELAGRVIEAFISGATLKAVDPISGHNENSSRAAMPLVEHSRVRLLKAMPRYHLRAGSTGTIVHVYSGGKGLEVEFNADSKSPQVVTLKSEAVEPLADS